MLGRSLLLRVSRLLSSPARMSKRRPDPTSTMGAKVQSLKNLLKKPLPQRRPELYTALKTKRCRWSKIEVERSALGLSAFCTDSGVSRSVESSIACDQV